MNQGLVIFKKNSLINHHHIFNSIDWLQRLRADDEWDVSIGRYEVLQELKFFQNAETLYLKQLKLRWTMNQFVLSNISSISFPRLKQLFLNGNNLMSIQPITQVYLPNLQVLNLKQNYILFIGPLRKCNFKNLKQLSLYKNQVMDAEKLNQLNAPKLQKVWFNGTLQEGNVMGSITWMAKFESNKHKSLIIAHNRRIPEQEAKDKLDQKIDNVISFQYVMQDDRHLNWL